MGTDEGRPESSVCFEYPSRPWKLPLCCYVLLLGVLSVLYAPALYRVSPWQLVLAYGIYVGFVATVLWQAPAYLFGNGPVSSVAVNEEGIQLDDRLIPWGRIERIDYGPLWMARPFGLRIKVERETGFFEWSGVFADKAEQHAFLPGHPGIYRDILPHALRHRPDMEILSGIRKKFDDPETGRRHRRWVMAGGLVVNTVLLVLLYPAPTVSIWTFLYAGMPLFILAFAVFINLIPAVPDTREAFLGACLMAPVTAVIGVQATLFFFCPVSAYQTIVVVGLLFTAAGGFVVLGTGTFKRLTQAAVLLFLVVGTVGAHFYFHARLWPRREVTEHFPQPPPTIMTWAHSGRYVAGQSGDDLTTILNAQSLRTSELPDHPGTERLRWLGERFVVRTTDREEKPEELWVYDMREGKEQLVARCHQLIVGPSRPFHRADARLVWLEQPEEGSHVLRIKSMASGGPGFGSTELPGGVCWRDAGWRDGRNIVVHGAEKGSAGETCTWHVVHIAPGGNIRSHVRSETAFHRFRAGPGMRYAVASKGKDWWSDPCYAVALEDGQAARLPPGDSPIHVTSSSRGYRVVQGGEKSSLQRLDLETNEQERLCTVPKGLQLLGYSEKNSYALLTPAKGLLQIPAYLLMHVPTGKKHWIRLPGMGFVSEHSSGLTASIPGASPLSPRGRKLLLESMDVREGFRLFLCDIPTEWPQEAAR